MMAAKVDAPALLEGEIAAFQALVRRKGEELWRELPWRGIDDDYAVLVSEVMLQQTQVKRVERYWNRFLALLPTIDALAAAETSLVLELWQGLGYNRRALMLQRCARECADRHAGKLPESYEELVALPGIGPATAAGVMAFAHDKPCVYLETNVRSVFLHHFFPDAQRVPDAQIVPLVRATCPNEDVRGWYYALLDYGAHLKATMPNPSRRSAGHTRQSAFEGSRRQKRAQLVRIVLGEPGIAPGALHDALDAIELEAGRDVVDAEEFDSITEELVREGFFAYDGKGYRA